MHTKTIAIGLEKGNKWTSTARGPHKKVDSIPLVRIIRDFLGYADNAKEAKRIIHNGKVLVNKRPVRDHKFGVGLMDVIEIPETKDHYVVLKSIKGLKVKKVNESESKKKLCRIVDKKVVNGGKVQYNLHDGSNVLSDKKFKVGDTLVLELPSMKITESIEYAKGCTVVIVNGRHTGAAGTIDEITEGTKSRKSLTKVGDIKTLTEYVFAVGKHKELIEG
ncbi:MAG: 30S ribosomal protein S4e [Candidatus Altiarchaeota archaeon]|nr:30S ribosomal protein S4e [Candidatus Altiarchaeota archaeon]